MDKGSTTTDNRFAQLGAYIHSRLDELGLDVYQYRVYCHLLRRADKKSHCNPSIRTIGLICQISQRKVQDVLCQLVDRQLIKRQSQRAKHGGPTSDLITILGVPPDAPHAPPLVQDMHHPGAPGAYKGNPYEGNPIYTYGSDPECQTRKKNPRSNLLDSHQLPESFSSLSSEFTADALTCGWRLTRLYYTHFNFAKNHERVKECLSAMADANQVHVGFADAALAVFSQYTSLTPQQREDAIREQRLLPRATPYWDMIKRIQTEQSRLQPSLPLNDPRVEAEKARRQQAEQQPASPDFFRQLRKERPL